MGIFSGKDTNPYKSELFFKGLSFSFGSSGTRYEFINYMRKAIYSRIMWGSLSVVSMSKEEKDTVYKAAANNPVDDIKGFIPILTEIASKKGKGKIYRLELETRKEVYFSTKYKEDNDGIINMDLSNLDEASLVCLACSLMYDVFQAAAKGIDASKALLFRIGDLEKQMGDKAGHANIKNQVASAAESIKDGKTAFIGGGSNADFLKFDTSPSTVALGFCFNLVTIGTGYPLEFFNGIGGSSLSDTGASTEKAIRRANEQHALSIVIPFLNAGYPKIKFSVAMPLGSIQDIESVVSLLETEDEILSPRDKSRLLSMVGLEGNVK